MIMQLQKYHLTIIYKRGKELYIADTLSRNHPRNVDNLEKHKFYETIASTSEIEQSIQQINMTDYISISDKTIQNMKEATNDDITL